MGGGGGEGMEVSPSDTHQPDDDRVVAHLRGSVEGRHPVIGSDAGICLAVLEQVLDDLQVALLTGQVERRGTILGLRVDEAAGRNESWVMEQNR